jgi:hypothetical protein
MNNYIYPIPKNFQQVVIEELKKVNETLYNIEKQIPKEKKKKEKNYLEKDDNYHMI